MSLKSAREAFKEMVNLCYDEDYPELHKELISLEAETKKSPLDNRYEEAMKEILAIIPLFAEDFPDDVLYSLENIYQEFLDE